VYDPTRYSAQGFVQRPSFNLSIPPAVQSPPPPVSASQANFEEEDDDDDDDDDDPWDVEMEYEEGSVHPSEQSKTDLNNMLMLHASHDERRGTRSFNTFLNHKNILASYRPSHAALPQADEKAARIFCHFVSSTGPGLTIFERSATQQPLPAGITAISGFQQPLWTYTLPSLALHHPPLMHAMLALSALHISKLQQTSPGPSIKHFTYALRRVGRLIGLPKRRNEVTTLAANLLLGFYEVMSAETSKWNIHLSGARVLVMEIDFAGKTRKIRALRAQAKNQLSQLDPSQQSEYMRYSGIPKSLLPDGDWDIDEDRVSTFTGYQVRYDYQYQTNISQQMYDNLEFTTKDVELYKMQADLYWWYCKQDIFQSMISGNRLLMRYDHWVFCPPRGQLGQLGLIYATMDHLCLILARLADFGGKDQGRKRKAMAAPIPSASQSNAHPKQPPGPQMPGQGPPMGYMPPSDNPMPMHSAWAAMSANLKDSGLSQATFDASPTQSTDSEDLEAETNDALVEHAAISNALDIFERSLPPEYQPLPRDAAPPISTPFGPALQYRTHTISCIWAFYYSGRILLARLHPKMPPAAMISAQVAAAQTAAYAQRIGKICAGLYYPQQYNLQTGALNPSLGGALIESTFFLFFAAIQFQDPAQRGWTINKLKEIARLSGWQTAAAVAAGCEFAWEATGKAGRGPPYKPTMDWRSRDDRVGDKAMKNQAKMAKAELRRDAKMGKGKERASEVANAEADAVAPSTTRAEDAATARAAADAPAAATASRQDEYFVAAGTDGPPRRIRDYRSYRRRGGRRRGGGGGGGEGFGPDGNDDGGEEEEEEDDEEEDPEPEAITHDRNTIGTNPYARTHWALGLLSLDEDIAKIDLGK
jgi:Fungal specific transcription factor domain